MVAGSPLVGIPKGMEQVLRERNMFPNGKLKVKCIKEKSKDENGIPVKLDEGQETTPLHKGEPGKPCCCHWLLNQCEDFQNQKSHIQEIVEEAGHHCIFLPKFHPELNFIERFWGHVKSTS